MKTTKIEYTIDYEKHLKSIFPFPEKQPMVNQILNGIELKKLTCIVSGHDEEDCKVTHVIDSNYITNPENGEHLFFDDKRIETCIKRIILLCEAHYVTRNDNRLPFGGVEWRIIT